MRENIQYLNPDGSIVEITISKGPQFAMSEKTYFYGIHGETYTILKGNVIFQNSSEIKPFSRIMTDEDPRSLIRICGAKIGKNTDIRSAQGGKIFLGSQASILSEDCENDDYRETSSLYAFKGGIMKVDGTIGGRVSLMVGEEGKLEIRKGTHIPDCMTIKVFPGHHLILEGKIEALRSLTSIETRDLLDQRAIDSLPWVKDCVETTRFLSFPSTHRYQILMRVGSDMSR